MGPGPSSYTPVLVRTTASLEQVSSALQGARYDRDPSGSGWGSVLDDTDTMLGKITRQRPRGGKAASHRMASIRSRSAPATTGTSSTRRSFEFDAQGEAGLYHRLRACDVTLAPTGQQNELLGIFSESQPRRLKTVIDGLADALESVDPSMTVDVADNPFSFGDEDFFLWVLYRATHSAKLSDNLSIVEIRALSNESIRSRITAMGKGVDLARPELITLISDQSNRFGPVRFVVWSEDLNLTLYLQIKKSGEFSIYRGDSFYDGEEMLELPEEEQRLRLFQDSAFHVVPELKFLHGQDSDWRDVHRAEFHAWAKGEMQDYVNTL